MCGIAGAVTARGRAHQVGVQAMCDRLAHRGPDAAGLRRFQACVLGHRRLRILDLSPLGDQPMTNEDESVWVAYNGEIYNFVELRQVLERAGHQFRSRTDSEVLVHLYEEHGEEMVERLRGMFAFAIWDEGRQHLLLARDRLGIKPLYYRIDGPDLFFGSEARVLVTDTTSLDRASVVAYLHLGWVPGPATIWSCIHELLPAHVLTWSGGQLRTRRYWAPSRTSSAPDDRVAALRAVLLDSLRRHLVADVPVGLFLSAGVDSVALASLGAELDADLRAFTVAFDEAPDEAAEAQAIASQLGTPHQVTVVNSDWVLASIENVVRSMDQPSVDGVNSWVISRAVQEAGIVVALSGLGGDELFSGYSTFRHVPRLARLGQVAAHAPPAVRQRGVDLLARPAIRYSRAARALSGVAGGGIGDAYAAVRGVLRATDAARLAGTAPHQEPAIVVPPDNGVSAVTQLELANYLPFQLLRDTDVMSMAHALEVRVPLLDDAVVETALALDHEDGPADKRLLAAACRRPMVERVAQQPKRTFTLPFERWLRGPLGNAVRPAIQRLTEPDVGFDRAEVNALWDAWEHGRVGWRSVWAVAVFGLWLN